MLIHFYTCFVFFFFFKQKTAYEMRISDWSSDVCSSDLLILADALTRASEEDPELILDFATLTGAARVALGPDLPALFANDDALSDALCDAGAHVDDPICLLPVGVLYPASIVRASGRERVCDNV